MSPIPANASAAMVFSFFVAVIITPWLMLKLGKAHADHGHGPDAIFGECGHHH
jgi:multidrug efflux pump subunit AcrB